MADTGELLDLVFDHLCEHQAEAVACLPDGEIQRRARLGIARAQALGFQEPANITAYVALMFIAGPRFDEQPNIRKALTDPSFPPGNRFATLFDTTAESDWDQAGQLPQTWD